MELALLMADAVQLLLNHYPLLGFAQLRTLDLLLLPKIRLIRAMLVRHLILYHLFQLLMLKQMLVRCNLIRLPPALGK